MVSADSKGINKAVISIQKLVHVWAAFIMHIFFWKRVFAMTSAFSWQNSISLCGVSFHTPRPNLPVTPGVF